jgi:hypothetical protein
MAAVPVSTLACVRNIRTFSYLMCGLARLRSALLFRSPCQRRPTRSPIGFILPMLADVEGNNSQILAIWGAQFVTGPYAGQLIPAVAGQASGLWRAQFFIGVLVDLGKPRRLGHLK